MRRAFIIIALIFLTAIPAICFAYSSNICANPTCSVDEVGRFMQGITQQCGNLGNCSISDIMLVFTNIALFVLGIVGSLVLMFYVIGGFYMLTSHGDSGKVTKGKKYITISTTGLVIVLIAYMGVEFLLRTLTEGRVSIATESCLQKEDGTPCGDFLECKGEICMSSCTAQIPGGYCANVTVADQTFAETGSMCVSGYCATDLLCCPAPTNE